MAAFDAGFLMCDMHMRHIGINISCDQQQRLATVHFTIVDAGDIVYRDMVEAADLQYYFGSMGRVIVDDWLGHLGAFMAPEVIALHGKFEVLLKNLFYSPVYQQELACFLRSVSFSSSSSVSPRPKYNTVAAVRRT